MHLTATLMHNGKVNPMLWKTSCGSFDVMELSYLDGLPVTPYYRAYWRPAGKAASSARWSSAKALLEYLETVDKEVSPWSP